MSTPELNKPDITPQEPVQIKEPEPKAEVEEVAVEQGQTQSAPPVVPPVVQPQPQASPPADDQTITITIPATPAQLEDWSKGDPESSLTWYAFFWIRMIKKAFAHGYRVVTGGTSQPGLA